MNQKMVKKIRKIFGPREDAVRKFYQTLSPHARSEASRRMDFFLSAEDKEALLNKYIKLDTPIDGEEE